MGVPRAKSGKASKGSKNGARAPPQMSPQDCFEEAELAFAGEDFDAARTHFQRALDLEPENVEFLDGYGAFLAEVGPQAEAVEVLSRSATLAPESGYEKYMYLGQLLEGEAAVEAARKGVAILRQQLAGLDAPGGGAAAGGDPADVAELRAMMGEQLGSALCAVAELLTNAADEAAAGGGAPPAGWAADAEALLGEARALAPSSPEPLQALASLRRAQGDDAEALRTLRSSMALWYREDGDYYAPLLSSLEGAAGGGAAARAGQQGISRPGDAAQEEGAAPSGQEPPSFEFRVETAKLLLELDDTTDAAATILEQLLEENDAVPEVHLLLTQCYAGGGELAAALAVAQQGAALCKKLRLPEGHELAEAFGAIESELKEIAAAEGVDLAALEASGDDGSDWEEEEEAEEGSGSEHGME